MAPWNRCFIATPASVRRMPTTPVALPTCLSLRCMLQHLSGHVCHRLSRALRFSTHGNPQSQTHQSKTVQDLLGDSNPMVVANALCALTEIKENASYEVVRFTPALLFKLLRALNECTEWGQVRAFLSCPCRWSSCNTCISWSMSCQVELHSMQLRHPSFLGASITEIAHR